MVRIHVGQPFTQSHSVFMEAKSLQELVPFAIIPANAARFAARIVKTTRELDQIELDYSIESLKLVDEILEASRSFEGVTPLKIAATLFGYGCYVGEVIIRNNPGAHWTTLTEDETESSLNSGLVVIMPQGTQVNPIGKAEKRLLNGDLDSLAGFYDFIIKLDREP